MSGQPWLGAAGSFLTMWVVMMVAMMLPSLVPTLWRYRQAGLGWLTALVGVGYFVVWTVFGMAAFPLGVALARAVPIAVGVVVLMAGFLQVLLQAQDYVLVIVDQQNPGHGSPRGGQAALGRRTMVNQKSSILRTTPRNCSRSTGLVT